MKTPSDCTRCRSCGFWIRRNQKTCPNCGISSPSRTNDARQVLLVALLSFSSSILSLIVLFTLFLYVSPEGRLRLLFLIPALLSVPGTVSVLRFLSGARRDPHNLLKSGDRILSRIRELDGLMERISSLKAHMRNLDDGGRKQSLNRILTGAAVEISRYSRDYRLQLCRYEVIRWYNGLLPLSAAVTARDFDGAEKSLSGLSGLIGEGERLLESITTDTAISESEGGRKITSNLRARIAHCRDLYEEVITLQARNLLKGISPAALAARNTLSEELFDAQTVETDVREALVSLSDSFSDLETEYGRFREELKLEKI